MSETKRLWTRDELILAIKLYCELPFGKMHKRNPEIIRLANLIERTPSALALKLVNFASLDPSLTERGIRGMRNIGHLDMEVWDEFYSDWERLTLLSAEIQAGREGKTLRQLYDLSEDEFTLVGEEKEQITKVRVKQSFFRATVLASYDYTCCITGLKNDKLLIAGHIVPWSEDKYNRLNPRNGLCLNGLHDRAFEYGLITITPDYKIKVSNILKKKPDENVVNYFLKYEDCDIYPPKRFLPDKQFLEVHNFKFRENFY